jgi:hypothetical protein
MLPKSQLHILSIDYKCPRHVYSHNHFPSSRAGSNKLHKMHILHKRPKMYQKLFVQFNKMHKRLINDPKTVCAMY